MLSSCVALGCCISSTLDSHSACELHHIHTQAHCCDVFFHVFQGRSGRKGFPGRPGPDGPKVRKAFVHDEGSSSWKGGKEKGNAFSHLCRAPSLGYSFQKEQEELRISLRFWGLGFCLVSSARGMMVHFKPCALL